MWRALVPATLAVLAATAQAQEPQVNHRDLQWLARATNGSGEALPSAIFLAWDYSAVLFVAQCGDAPGTLKLRHPAYWPIATANPEDGRLRLAHAIPMRLGRGDASVAADVHLENSDSELVGIFRLTPALLAILAPSDDELLIDVENETGDPWFAGRAQPLFDLARTCVDAQ